MDILLIKILLIGLPGILGYMLYTHINGISDNKRDWDPLLLIFIFSVIPYIILDYIVRIMPSIILNSLGLDNYSFSKTLIYLENNFDSFGDIPMIWLMIITIITVYVASYLKNKRCFNRIAIKLNITKRIGADDIWAIFHDTYHEWVTIRDYKTGLVYFGYIEYFSDQKSYHELLLQNVSVYTAESELIYTLEKLYLSREHNEIDLEIHNYLKDPLKETGVASNA